MRNQLELLKEERSMLLEEIRFVRDGEYYNNWEAPYVSVSVGCILQSKWSELNAKLNIVEEQIKELESLYNCTGYR
jgi:hypothetical protein